MKNIRLILAIVASVFVVVSCCKADVIQENEKQSEKEQPSDKEQPSVPGVLTAIVEDTKTYLIPNSEETSYNVVWNNGDRISTLQDGKQGCYITDCQTGSSSATFAFKSGTGVSEGSFDAYYPSEIVQNGTLVWPEHQNYMEYAGGPMISAENEADDQGNATLKFKHLGGVIRFKLNTTEDFTVKAAMVKANEALSGSFTIEDGKAKITATSGMIVMDFDEGVTVNSTTTGIFCFAVPAGTYSGLAFTFLGTDGRMFTAKLKQENTLTVDRGVVTKIAASGVTPALSTEQGSNCYIFYQGGAPITIDLMGEYNSGTWIPLALCGASAEVVWESDCTDRKVNVAITDIISSAEYSNGRLTIKPTGNTGNAIVAVKNKDNKIIWSYHIWVPSTTVGNITYSSKSFMDRDLGVVTIPPKTYSATIPVFGGTLYQYGRKDPIVGCYLSNNASAVNHVWTYKCGSNTYYHADKSVTADLYDIDRTTQPTVENTIKNVMTLYRYSCSELTWSSSTTKTIFDPCPDGYRVPTSDEFSALPAISTNNKTYYNGEFICGQFYGIRITNNGYYAGSATNNFWPYWDASGKYQSRGTAGATHSWMNNNSDTETSKMLAAFIRCIKE